MRGNGEKTAVILDRHPLWLEALERLVSRAGFAIACKTASPAMAFETLDNVRPAVFIAEYESLDQLPDWETVLRRAVATNPQLHVVILSEGVETTQIDGAFAAGASVYCAKTADGEDLAAAIRQGSQTSVYYARFREAPLQGIVAQVSAGLGGLTKREVEILKLVAEGYSNSQLAKMLWVTEQTVKFHLSNIYRKLEVANRTEAARWAQVNGLLPAVTAATPATAAA